MRSIDEIVARVRAEAEDDIFGITRGDLMEWLPFDRVKEWLKPEATPADWIKLGFPRALTDEAVIAEIKAYMPFAWDKANNCRGLSALRNIYHMRAWMWLLAEDKAFEALRGDYQFYGKPFLRAICERFDIDWRGLDNGTWCNNEDGHNHGVQDAADLGLSPKPAAAAPVDIANVMGG